MTFVKAKVLSHTTDDFSHYVSSGKISEDLQVAEWKSSVYIFYLALDLRISPLKEELDARFLCKDSYVHL